MRAHARARRFIAMSDGEAISATEMPRYVVRSAFHEGSHFPGANGGAELCLGVTERNAEEGGSARG